MEHSERVQSCQVALLIFLGDKPRLHTIEDHVVDCHSVSQMDCFLHAEDAEHFQLDGRERVQKDVEFLVYVLLDALVDGDDELVRLVLRELPLRVNDGLHASVNELLLKHV